MESTTRRVVCRLGAGCRSRRSRWRRPLLKEVRSAPVVVRPRSRRCRSTLGACPRALPAAEIPTNDRVGFRSKPTLSLLFRLFHHRPGSTQTSGNRSFSDVTLGSHQDIELVLVDELVPATAKVGTRAVVIDQRSGQGRPSDPILRDELRFIASSSSHDPLYSSMQAPSHPSRGSGVRRAHPN
jgi:hypothetical protein